MIQQLHTNLNHSKCHGEEAMDGDNVIHKKREVKKTFDIVPLVVVIPHRAN